MPTLPALPCLCATARRAARTLTQLYDSYMRATGIEAAQFALLALLKERPAAAQTEIARLFAFDKTTVSRNLKLFERNGWIAPASAPRTASKDGRRRAFLVTDAGVRQLAAAQHSWRQAQRQLRSRLTSAEWQAAWRTLNVLAEAAARD